jgi:predicted DCC family thiol-disulfide oxidoreductase YuxK
MIPNGMARDPTVPDRRWTVVYDRDCGFCKWLLSYLLAWDRSLRLRPLALGTPEADRLLSDLPPDVRATSWHLIDPNGRRRSGGAALPELLRLLPAGSAPASLLDTIPGVTDRGYRWVAEHRSMLSRGVPASLKRRAGRVVRERELATAPPDDPPGSANRPAP